MSPPRKSTRTIGPTRSKRLIRDLIAAEHDLVELAQLHRLTPDDLAAWIAQPDHQNTLAGLCVLADLQTQLLLSRYRLLAAGRLIQLATGSDGTTEGGSGGGTSGGSGGGDVARRACVDLLKMDLKRAPGLTGPMLDALGAASSSKRPTGICPDDDDADPLMTIARHAGVTGDADDNRSPDDTVAHPVEPSTLRDWLYNPPPPEAPPPEAPPEAPPPPEAPEAPEVSQ